MKYFVKIPKPSAKRLENDRRLLINLITCWETRILASYVIPVGEDIFEFDLEGEIEQRDPEWLDADYYHEFIVEYRNSTGSRIERLKVEPLAFE